MTVTTKIPRYLLLGAVAFPVAIGVFLPLSFREIRAEARRANEPVKAYYLDLNDDGKKDIVVRHYDGHDSIFLQDEDSRYHRLEDVIEHEKKDAEYGMKIREDKLRGIIQTKDAMIKEFDRAQN